MTELKMAEEDLYATPKGSPKESQVKPGVAGFGEYLNLIGALLAFTASHSRFKLASSTCGSLP